MDETKTYEQPKAEPVGNVTDMLGQVPRPEGDVPAAAPPRIPELVGTRWRWASGYLSQESAIAAGHMLADTFGGVARDLDGKPVDVHAFGLTSVLEVVRQEVVPNPFDPSYPRLRALLVEQRTGWRRLFVFSLVFNESYTGAACTPLRPAHDMTDPYCGVWVERSFLRVCSACGSEPSWDGLCRETGWRQRLDEMVVDRPSSRELERAPRPELPVMDVVGGAGAAAIVCGGLRAGGF